MPPAIKKKKIYVLPPLSFVTSPTPSTIKFPNSGSSQSQPLEVPTVPYSEGGKWLAMQFTQSDIKITKLPGRRGRKLKTDFSSGITQKNLECGVVSGCEPLHRISRSCNSATSYVPLDVTVSKRTTGKKQHSRHGSERKSDDVANNSSHTSEDETMRTVNIVNDNSVCIHSDRMDVAKPFAFSVKTPLFESRSVETTNSDKTLRLESHSVLNLEDSCCDDVRTDDLKRINNCSASPKCKDRHFRKLFQSFGSEDCDSQEPEVLAPDTPEHEHELTFYQRRIKKRRRGVEQPG